nr:momilactone A synthase-like [Quercus suber]
MYLGFIFIFPTHILTPSTMGSFSLLSAAARRLEGKVALITGGSSGIGESTARLFSKHGAKVVIADIQDELGHSVREKLNPQSTSFVHCDVTKETDVENAVNHAVFKYGKLDIMYNNAGIVGVAKPNILDNTKAEFEQVLSVNLVGAFLGTKHAARMMIPAKKGSIINTASVCSIIGGASHGYTSSKHGLVGLMRNTAVELGQFGIRVNCVSPYLVATPLAKDFFKLDDDAVYRVYSNLKGEVLQSDDIAEAALYLGSDESKYVSGHNIVIDGGFTIVNPGFCMFAQS